MEENMIVKRDSITFCFHFDFPKDLNENLNHETEFIIKSDEILPKIIVINETEQLLLKSKHGNNLNEHGKYEWAERMNLINLFLTCHKY